MSQLRRTMGTAGAAALLVLAAFSAGSAAAPAPAPAPAPVSVAGPVPHEPPDPDDRDSIDDAGGGVSVNAVPGPGSAELLYVPVAPCRVIDTRNGSGSGGTPLGSNTSRSYYVAGTNGFTAQGGKPGGCGVPEAAQAVAATVLAYDPSAAGRLRTWPTGTTEPGVVTLYYGSSSATTGTTINLATGAGRDASFRNNNATTDLIVDVTGYYVPAMYAYVSSSGSVIDHSGRLVSSSRTTTGLYTLVWDRDISSCAGTASSDVTGYIVSVYTTGSTSYVYVYNNAGAATDYWFNVVITC